MEPADYKAFDDPEGDILKPGGHILVALYKNKPEGVCTLKKMDDPEYGFELVKMAVDPDVQGKGIGWLPAEAVIEKARRMGGSRILSKWR